jgi:hypothetical protein
LTQVELEALQSGSTLPGDGVQPVTPSTVVIESVDLSPRTNPEAQIFDVATLDSVSEGVAQAMKRCGYTTVGACRELSQADLEALPGVGKRIAERILAELAKTLPPLVAS